MIVLRAHGATLNKKRVGIYQIFHVLVCILEKTQELMVMLVLTTNNKKFYNRIKNFRNLGSDKKFIHTQIGFNSRLDTIQAAVLNHKLKKS